MIDTVYTIPFDQIADIPWTGSPMEYDSAIHSLGSGHKKFKAINPYLDNKELIKFIDFVQPTNPVCVVWTYNDEWVMKLFDEKWKPAHGYHSIEIKISYPQPNSVYTVPYKQVADIPWTGSSTEYDTKLHSLGRGYKKFKVINPYIKNKNLVNFIDFFQPDSPVCVVWTYNDEWVMKLFDSRWRPEHGYQYNEIDYPSLSWFRNESINKNIVFDKDPVKEYSLTKGDEEYQLAWYLDPKYSKTKDKVWVVLAEADGFDVKSTKDMGMLTPVFDRYLDVIFISYNEPNAEENWNRVLEKAPWAKRVNGVKGIFEAHKKAAELAETESFYVVDGDAYLTDDWEFNLFPDVFDNDYVYVWNSINPVNGLVYGYGGVKLFPKQLLLETIEWTTLDMTTTVIPDLKVMDTVSNITRFNTDPFSTWRSAFRETVKLLDNIKNNPDDQESKDRLNIWLTEGDNNVFGKYSKAGATAAKNFFESSKDLKQINNREYLESVFDKPKNRYPYIRLEHSNPLHNEWFVVNWCLGNTCNFECSYCPEDLHNGTNPWPDPDVIKNFILQVKAAHPTKKLYFEFTGGEVTLYKHFIDICKFCTEQGVRVGFISNGSRTLRYWQENKQYFEHVCLSFHPEFAEEEHFINVVKELHNDIRTHVNIMMSPEKFDYCYAVANKIKNLGNISMALQPLVVDFGEVLYEYNDFQKKVFEKQHELIVKHIKHTKQFDYYRGAMRMVDTAGNHKVAGAHRFISEKANDWSGWKCYAGVEQLIVDMDGTIRRGWCKVGENIGNIHDATLLLPTEPVVCNKTMCHCNFDIMCTKEL